MSNAIDNDKSDEIDFSWGIKRGRGGQKKEVQFYESFTYDGVEYFLYDSVYLFKEGETKPYIGKLIKIWEHSNNARKVKVLWFFYPSEISNYIKGENVLENELFLASGVGKGLANINPLVILLILHHMTFMIFSIVYAPCPQTNFVILSFQHISRYFLLLPSTIIMNGVFSSIMSHSCCNYGLFE